MTTVEYIEKLREALHEALHGDGDLTDALAALALPIPDDGPKPWPPPNDLTKCLVYSPRHDEWINSAKGPLEDWAMVMPYIHLTYWLPMPPAPEVKR